MLVVEHSMLVRTAELLIRPGSLSKKLLNLNVNLQLCVGKILTLISFSGHFHGSIFVNILCRLFLEGTSSYFSIIIIL